MMMLSPVWLKTFTALVEIGHFTRTAEALHMTQPGVTQHMQKLEQACGQALLVKIGKKFELTEAGQTLYHYAKQQFEQENQLLDSIRFDDPAKGEVKVACSGALAQFLYPKFIAMQKDNPRLQVHFEAAPFSRICKHILEGNSRLGLPYANIPVV